MTFGSALSATMRPPNQIRTSRDTVCQVFIFLPVKMLLNASSTFVESNAEVSINDRVFFSNVGGNDIRLLNMYNIK